MSYEEKEALVMLEEDQGFYPVDAILRDAGIEPAGPTPFGKSWWGEFIRCPYHGLRLKRDGWSPAKRKALVVGILFHACLQRYYVMQDFREAFRPLDVVFAWCREHWCVWAQTLWSWAELTHVLVAGYAAQYPRRGLGPLTVEQLMYEDPPRDAILGIENILECNAPFPYSVRYDLVVRAVLHNEECVVSIDTKTVGFADWTWELAFWQDPQLSGHFHTWNSVMGPQGAPPMRAAIINAVEKPKRRGDSPRYRRYCFQLQEDRIWAWRESMRQPAAQWAAMEPLLDVEKYPSDELHHHVTQNGWVSCFNKPFERACERIYECLAVRSVAPALTSTSLPAAEPEPTVPEGTVVSPPVVPLEAPSVLVQELSPLEAALVELEALAGEHTGIAWLRSASPLEVREYARSLGLEIVEAVDVAKLWIEWVRASTPPQDCAADIDWSTTYHEIEGVAARDAVTWMPYHARARLAWATPYIAPTGERIFWLRGRVELLVPQEAIVVQVQVQPRSKAPVVDDTAQPRKVGEAPKTTGLVPVYYLGTFPASNRKLKDWFFKSTTEAASSFGIALVGKDEKRKLKVFSIFDGMCVEAKRTDVGKDVWELLGRLVPEVER
jgi:hypothetical protein